MRRTWILALVIVLTAAILGACSSKKEEAAQSAPARDSATSSGSSGRPAEASKASPPMAPGAAAAPSPTPAPAAVPDPVTVDRKIIKNASFDVKVKDGDAAVNKVTASVTAAGGYVQDVRQSGTKVQGRTINMTVRVPSGRYESITTLVRELGEVNNQHEWTQDVTEQYVDLEERIKSKEAHLNQLQKLYTQTGSIKELMELESEIGRVTAELESMKGRMRVLSAQVAFSTMVINLYEPGVPTPISPPKTVWERMTRGFTESWNGVVNFLSALAVAIVAFIPVLALLSVFGGIGYVIYLFVRRRTGK